MCDSILCLKYRKYSSLCYQAQRRHRRSISCLGYSKRLKCKAPLMVPRGRREDDTTEDSTFMTDIKIISTKQMSWSFAFQFIWKSVWFNFTLVHFSFDVVFFLNWVIIFPFHLLLCDSPGLTGSGHERTPHLSLFSNMFCTTVAYFAATPDFLMQYHSWHKETVQFLLASSVLMLTNCHLSHSITVTHHTVLSPLVTAALHITLVLKNWNQYTSLLTFNKCVKHLGQKSTALTLRYLHISTGMEIWTSGLLYTLHSCPHFLQSSISSIFPLSFSSFISFSKYIFHLLSMLSSLVSSVGCNALLNNVLL